MDRTDVVENLYAWSRNKKQPPVNVELHPTYKCNSLCIFCDQRKGLYDYNNAMKKEKWLQIIDELYKLGTKKIQISGGGEPMMVPDITISMIRRIKKHGIEGKINTNGTLWKKDDLRTLVDSGWDKIIFSIDGPNANIHDYLRGKKGMFRNAVKNIKYLSKLKSKLKVNRPLIEINSVITNTNFNKVSDLVKLCKKIGVNSITLEPVFITVDYVYKLKLNKEQSKEFNALLKHAKALADSYGIENNFESLILLEKFEKTGDMKELVYSNNVNNKAGKNNFGNLACFEPWYFPKIGPNGEVGPCCNYPYIYSSINIRNKKFEDVWFGKEMKKFRKDILNRKFNEICENCTFTRVAINNELRKQLKEYKRGKDGIKNRKRTC